MIVPHNLVLFGLVIPLNSHLNPVTDSGQPYFATRVEVPAGSPAAPIQVYLINNDRGETAIIHWQLIVD